MHEQILLPNQTTEQAAIRAAAIIGQRALAAIDTQYGSGMPLWVPGIQPLPYHNGFHGRQVGEDSARIVEQMGLGAVCVALAETAGRAHDLSSHLGRGTDEAKSAEWLVQQMTYEGMHDTSLQTMGKLGIIGTEPAFNDKGAVIGQKVDQLEFPSKDAELFARAIACGDFGNLYRPAGPLLGHLYFQELNPDAEDFPADKLVNFQRNQLVLLNNHKFAHPLGEAMLTTHRGPVTDYSEAILGQLERGELTSWQQVIDQDAAFMRSAANTPAS
jgi:hypothetical protein